MKADCSSVMVALYLFCIPVSALFFVKVYPSNTSFFLQFVSFVVHSLPNFVQCGFQSVRDGFVIFKVVGLITCFEFLDFFPIPFQYLALFG